MSSSAGPVLSKSRYLSGLQCRKKLWTEVHAPELVPPVDPLTQSRFDEGHEVGRLARRLFPGGLEIGPGMRRWDAVVADTERALTQRRPLYEAAFRGGGAACRVDILVPVAGGRWDVLEVKSATGVKDVHLSDLALQGHVLAKCDLPVGDFYLVHLDASYLRRGELDLKALFQMERVTEVVSQRVREVGERLAEMSRVLQAISRPEVPIGRHCEEPYSCSLKEDCWSYLPPRSVLELTRGRNRAFELLQRGVVGLTEIPSDEALDFRQTIQLDAVRTGGARVDQVALRSFLDDLSYPLYFFDLETYAPAVPRFDESRPYQPIPFLFSIHRQERRGESTRHYAYLSDHRGDPRPDFIRAVRASLESSGSILAYNTAYERRILRETAKVVDRELEDWALALEARFIDLWIPFRDFAYHHPDQGGSTSLKDVVTPLTGLSYADLEISQGEQAGTEYRRIIDQQDIDPVERARVRRWLVEYCSLDTRAMVEILREFEKLAAEPAEGAIA